MGDRDSRDRTSASAPQSWCSFAARLAWVALPFHNSAAACSSAASMFYSISSCRSDDGETAMGLCRKKELPRFVPAASRHLASRRTGPGFSYKCTANRLLHLSFSLQRHLNDGNPCTRFLASTPHSCGTSSHPEKVPSIMVDKYCLGPWVNLNMKTSNRQPYSEANSNHDFHSSQPPSNNYLISHSGVLIYPQAVNRPPLSYAVTPKIAPEHPYPARQYSIPPCHLPACHVRWRPTFHSEASPC
jgi:hypothetical protein